MNLSNLNKDLLLKILVNVNDLNQRSTKELIEMKEEINKILQQPDRQEEEEDYYREKSIKEFNITWKLSLSESWKSFYFSRKHSI
jgi:hypothetical protein